MKGKDTHAGSQCSHNSWFDCSSVRPPGLRWSHSARLLTLPIWLINDLIIGGNAYRGWSGNHRNQGRVDTDGLLARGYTHQRLHFRAIAHFGHIRCSEIVQQSAQHMDNITLGAIIYSIINHILLNNYIIYCRKTITQFVFFNSISSQSQKS